MSIEVRGISKRYGSYTALEHVDLKVETGELVALLGPSGSGKTTLLRIIAGLQQPDGGQVLFHGEDAINKSARDRLVGFVFQHYALFKHMTVFENVAFGLRVMPRKKRPSNKEIQDRVMELLGLVQVDFLAQHRPSQLSGGQRQRVALARALVIEPRVLLLDEPFGALDARVRRELRRWLRRLHDSLHITSVFVTHDQEEALELADRVAILDQGRIVQLGAPEEIYENPASPFVFEFLGHVNLFHGRLEGGKTVIQDAPGAADAGAPTAAGQNAAGTAGSSAASANVQPGIAGRVYVRPHELDIHTTRIHADDLAAEVTHLTRLGSLVRVELKRPNSHEEIIVETTHERANELQLQRGSQVYLQPRKTRLFPIDPEQEIPQEYVGFGANI